MTTADASATKTFETILYETKGPLCSITLNRQEKLNAANDTMVEELDDAFFEFDAVHGYALGLGYGLVRQAGTMRVRVLLEERS